MRKVKDKEKGMKKSRVEGRRRRIKRLEEGEVIQNIEKIKNYSWRGADGLAGIGAGLGLP